MATQRRSAPWGAQAGATCWNSAPCVRTIRVTQCIRYQRRHTSTRPYVTGCDIESNQGEKSPPTANVLIDSTGGSNAEVAITGCTIQHNHNAAGSANIRVKGPSARVVKGVTEQRDGHVTITGNVLSDVKENVHLDHARGVVITGNTFWTAYEHNLLAEHSAYVTVGPNNFDRNPRYRGEEKPATTNAIVFRDCADCTLSGFTLSGVRAAPAGVTLERCDRFNVANLTILDCDGAGLLLKELTNSRVAGCLIRDDRPNADSISLRTEGGRTNMIVENYLGRPGDILKGVGLVERNYDGGETMMRFIGYPFGYVVGVAQHAGRSGVPALHADDRRARAATSAASSKSTAASLPGSSATSAAARAR